MKNIYEILAAYGLEVPAEKQEEFDRVWKENYRTKAEYEKAVDQRETYKARLSETAGQLEKFKGVKPEELQAEIERLNGQLKAKEAEYAAKEEERAFLDTLKSAISHAGGRNAKAVMAMLDTESLKESKNQEADIKAAIEAVKASDAYLFGANEPINHPVGPTTGAPAGDGTAALRAAMGLPER